jgi:hypothetical protein
MLAFRHADRRFPFLWEGSGQPDARWNAAGGRPVQYFADTADGAWAEFLRHEEITTAEDVETIRRAMWAIELPDDGYAEPGLPVATLTGDRATYGACQAEARRLWEGGAPGLIARSAALRAGAASGWRVDGGLPAGPPRDGRTVALFGTRPELVGWCAALGGPPPELLWKVRFFGETTGGARDGGRTARVEAG